MNLFFFLPSKMKFFNSDTSQQSHFGNDSRYFLMRKTMDTLHKWQSLNWQWRKWKEKLQKAYELLLQAAGEKFHCRSKNVIIDHMKIVLITFLVLTPIIKWILFTELLMTKSWQPRLWCSPVAMKVVFICPCSLWVGEKRCPQMGKKKSYF